MEKTHPLMGFNVTVPPGWRTDVPVDFALVLIYRNTLYAQQQQ